MLKKIFLLILIVAGLIKAREWNFYSDINKGLIITPRSEALAGSDLSLSSGDLPTGTPANLPFDTMSSITLSYSNYFQNAFSTSVLSYIGHIGKQTGYSIAIGYIFIPDIEIIDDIDTSVSGELIFPEKIKTTSCSDIYIRVGFGNKFISGGAVECSWGSALNAQRTRLPDYNGYGIGIDAGMKLLFVKSGMSSSLALENLISSTVWSSSYRESAHPHLRAGLGWERDIPYIYGELRVGYTSPDLFSNEGINLVKTYDEEGEEIEKLEFHDLYKRPSLLILGAKFGIEYIIMDRVAVRFGLAQGKFSFGGGINLFSQRAGVDFSYSNHVLAGIYQISMKYLW